MVQTGRTLCAVGRRHRLARVRGDGESARLAHAFISWPAAGEIARIRAKHTFSHR